jgi:hypothetical protein
MPCPCAARGYSEGDDRFHDLHMKQGIVLVSYRKVQEMCHLQTQDSYRSVLASMLVCDASCSHLLPRVDRNSWCLMAPCVENSLASYSLGDRRAFLKSPFADDLASYSGPSVVDKRKRGNCAPRLLYCGFQLLMLHA